MLLELRVHVMCFQNFTVAFIKKEENMHPNIGRLMLLNTSVNVTRIVCLVKPVIVLTFR